MEDNLIHRAKALFCSSFKLTIEQGRSMGFSDTEILNVIYASCTEAVKGFEDECQELTNIAIRKMQ